MFSQGYCDETIALIELSLCDGIGPVVGKHLIDCFGSAQAVFSAHKSDWLGKAGLNIKLAHQLYLSQQNGLQAAQELAESHTQLGIQATSIVSEQYPYRLKEIANAPLVLYSKGEREWNLPRMIGVVGTRKPTPQGIEITKDWIQDLAPYNVGIVSGLAYGIDIHAHRTAFENQIPNWAVMAHGLDHIYPNPHKKTGVDIQLHGGLISDFPAFTKMHPDYFPKRNRIVAGLCDALLVVESSQKGGSMITASIAHGYNREVFAIPGRPSNMASSGCNALIKHNMAHLTESVEDIATVMGWTRNDRSPKSNNEGSQLQLFQSLNPTEKLVMQWLLQGIQHPDAMLQKTQCDASQIAMALLDLEIKGLISTQNGQIYTARKMA
jgi:DNA processing protein